MLGVRREARKEAMKTCLAAAIFTLGVPNKHACALYRKFSNYLPACMGLVYKSKRARNFFLF